MSKEAAMALATGISNGPVNPSLITGDMKTAEFINPSTLPEAEIPENPAVKQVLDSDRFALVAKKEAKLVREREEFKKERAKIEEEKNQLRSFQEKINTFEAKRKVDPIGALKDIGFSETEIFNFMAAQEKKEPTPEEVARAAAADEINKFKETQAKVAADAQKAREQGLVSNYRTQISSAIKADPDKYEYANYYGKEAEDLAVEIATANVKLNNELLTPEQLAEEVEKYFEEQDKAMSALKKRQPKVETASTTGTKADPVRTRTVVPPIGAPAPAPSKTLTNKVSATVASSIPRKETHEQKKARLIEALKRGSM